MTWTKKTLDYLKPAYLLGHDGRGEELPVADAGEVEVEDDGVVHRQPHQHPDQVILPAEGHIISTQEPFLTFRIWLDFHKSHWESMIPTSFRAFCLWVQCLPQIALLDHTEPVAAGNRNYHKAVGLILSIVTIMQDNLSLQR